MSAAGHTSTTAQQSIETPELALAPGWPVGAVAPPRRTDLAEAKRCEPWLAVVYGGPRLRRYLSEARIARSDIAGAGLAYAEGYAAGWRHHGGGR